MGGGFRWNDWNLQHATRHGYTIQDRTLKDRRASRKLTGQIFDAMPAAQKQAIYDEIDSMSRDELVTKLRPASTADIARAQRIVRRGRPKIGKGTRQISITVEADLLKEAEAYSRRNGLKRSELISQALRQMLPGPTARKRKAS